MAGLKISSGIALDYAGHDFCRTVKYCFVEIAKFDRCQLHVQYTKISLLSNKAVQPSSLFQGYLSRTIYRTAALLSSRH